MTQKHKKCSVSLTIQVQIKIKYTKYYFSYKCSDERRKVMWNGRWWEGIPGVSVRLSVLSEKALLREALCAWGSSPRVEAGTRPACGSGGFHTIVLVTVLENCGEDAAGSTAWFLSCRVQLVTFPCLRRRSAEACPFSKGAGSSQ